MYSWEIQRELEKYNYNIPASCYNEICGIDNNPQIVRIKYEPYGDYFEMYTNDGYSWRFKVYRDD